MAIQFYGRHEYYCLHVEVPELARLINCPTLLFFFGQRFARRLIPLFSRFITIFSL